MRVVALYAENFKKLRAVEIRPKGRVTMITGKNSAGKTSLLDALWFGLKGIKAMPLRAVRKGAERMKVVLETNEFIVTRTLTAGEGVLPSLTLEMAKGHERDKTPQKFLDDVFNAVTFDPLEFLRLDLKEQVAMLRAVVGVADFQELDQATKQDYDTRLLINRDVATLEGQVKLLGAGVVEGLPAEKINEVAILQRLNEAGELNKQVLAQIEAKRRLEDTARLAAESWENHTRFMAEQRTKIVGMQEAIATREALMEYARETLKSLEVRLKALQSAGIPELAGIEQALQMAHGVTANFLTTHTAAQAVAQEDMPRAVKALEAAEAITASVEARVAEARAAWEAAPTGEMVDVNAVTQELQDAQRTNRAIEQRRLWEQEKAKLDAKRAEVAAITRRMEGREETKRAAIAEAKMPVEGLSFSEQEVTFKGLPLANLGEGEQIRISLEIGMAANPRLRLMCIRNGEALDDEGLALVAELAEKYECDVWITKVDSSGKVGVVLEDGMVTARNEAAE